MSAPFCQKSCTILKFPRNTAQCRQEKPQLSLALSHMFLVSQVYFSGLVLMSWLQDFKQNSAISTLLLLAATCNNVLFSPSTISSISSMTPSLSDLAAELSEFLIDQNILLELLDIKLVLQSLLLYYLLLIIVICMQDSIITCSYLPSSHFLPLFAPNKRNYLLIIPYLWKLIIFIIFNNQQQQSQSMRNRSQSPIQPYPQQQKKYYTRQQVSQILRAMMESKLSNIYQQLQEKQQIIRTLNEKLNKNDAHIQHLTKQIGQLNAHNSQISEMQMDNTIQLINRILNEKLQNYWNTVQNQLNLIRNQSQDRAKKYHQAMQQKNDHILAEIKKTCEENIEAFKKKNNAYWVKVKQALNKMNTRTTQNEQKMGNIGLQINKYEAQREENIKTLKQLQNGKNTAKMLVQLKKSVANVYKNFEQVLKLQQQVKDGYEKMGSFDKWNCDKYANPELGPAANKNSWNYNRNNKNAYKQDDIVILEYSVQEDTMSNHQIHNTMKQDPSSRPHAKSETVKSNSPQKFKFGETFPLSPITGRVIQNSSLSNAQALMTSERFKTNHQTAVTNASMKNQTLQWAQHEEYGNPNHYYADFAKNDKSESFQLTPHNISNNHMMNSNGNSRMLITNNNQASTSMLNFSLECRKEMLECVRPRLIDMIQTKGMAKPIKVFLDQINYLKNQEGNYLFDLKGNMFKLNPSEFAELQRDKVIVNIKSNQQKKSRK